MLFFPLLWLATEQPAQMTMNGASLVAKCLSTNDAGVIYYENVTELGKRVHMSGVAPFCGGTPLTQPCAALPSEPARPGVFTCDWTMAGSATAISSPPISATAEAVGETTCVSSIRGYKVYVDCVPPEVRVRIARLRSNAD